MSLTDLVTTMRTNLLGGGADELLFFGEESLFLSSFCLGITNPTNSWVYNYVLSWLSGLFQNGGKNRFHFFRLLKSFSMNLKMPQEATRSLLQFV